MHDLLQVVHFHTRTPLIHPQILDKLKILNVLLAANLRRLLPLLLLPLLCLLSCEDNVSNEAEYVDWKATNEKAFAQRMAEARTAIAEAKAAYGAQWMDHCPWRMYRTYAQDERVPGSAADSICVRVIAAGPAGESPLYTDSVAVNYMLRLQPSVSYSEGKVADYSGPFPSAESVFHPDFAQPTRFLTSNTAEGFTTALLHMRPGDRWEVFIPQELGYGSTASSKLPAYSMLTFDMELVRFW